MSKEPCMCIPVTLITFWRHLFAHLIERVRAAVSVAELHVDGVVEQSQTAPGLQNSVGLLEKAWPVEPVKGRHGGNQVHWAVSKAKFFGHTLSKDGKTETNQIILQVLEVTYIY